MGAVERECEGRCQKTEETFSGLNAPLAHSDWVDPSVTGAQLSVTLSFKDMDLNVTSILHCAHDTLRACFAKTVQFFLYCVKSIL